MRVLVLSAYHADSHRSWVNGLMRYLPDIHWTVLSLPPRYFSWRIRGNSLTWAMSSRELLERNYDVVLATSMTDLSALRGLVPALCRRPTIVYFHENQFAYPQRQQQRHGVEPQILNMYTALAADKVVFNSAYNRQTTLDGCDELLAKLPDFAPREQVAKQLAEATVLPVGIAAEGNEIKSCQSLRRLAVLWNHRWEYDKAPDRLLASIMECDKRGLALDLYIAGQQFRQCPKEFAAIEALVGKSESLVLKQFGFVDESDQYQNILTSCDVVLSTAIHDFQGLAVLEAVAAGCTPLVPDRLCYPEWFAEDFRYAHSDDITQEAGAVADKLATFLLCKAAGTLPTADVSALTWSVLAPQYRQLFECAAASGDTQLT